MIKIKLNSRIVKNILVFSFQTIVLLLIPEIALAAAKFDLNAGVVAATKPLTDALTAHWGKGVLLSGGASALIGEGDMRQRALRAAIGCGAAGGVVLALIAMLA